jgi:hypothetical protein
VYHLICAEIRIRGTFKDAERLGVLIEDIVKPVSCLETQMDLHRGIDCFFLFHDPACYQEAKKANFGTPKPGEPMNPGVREARYWNAEKDTMVTMDITGYLGAKFGFAERDHTELIADVFASKTQSATNHYIRQQLAFHGAKPLPEREEKHGGKFYQNRMRILAERIVDAFEAKSGRLGGEKMPHIRNPEAEKQARVDALKAETKEKTGRLMERRKEEKEKKARGERRGDEAREAVHERTETNLDQLPAHERRIYEARQEAKKKLIERAKNEGKSKREE